MDAIPKGWLVTRADLDEAFADLEAARKAEDDPAVKNVINSLDAAWKQLVRRHDESTDAAMGAEIEFVRATGPAGVTYAEALRALREVRGLQAYYSTRFTDLDLRVPVMVGDFTPEALNTVVGAVMRAQVDLWQARGGENRKLKARIEQLEAEARLLVAGQATP
jgi:hypothetical protein